MNLVMLLLAATTILYTPDSLKIGDHAFPELFPTPPGMTDVRPNRNEYFCNLAWAGDSCAVRMIRVQNNVMWFPGLTDEDPIVVPNGIVIVADLKDGSKIEAVSVLHVESGSEVYHTFPVWRESKKDRGAVVIGFPRFDARKLSGFRAEVR